jgi:hypothetical protein
MPARRSRPAFASSLPLLMEICRRPTLSRGADSTWHFPESFFDEPLEYHQPKGTRDSATRIRLNVFSSKRVAKVADNAPSIYRAGRREIFVIMTLSMQPDIEQAQTGIAGSKTVGKS